MTLAELIASFRTDAFDNVAPFFSSDEDVTGWLNEAQAEACVRARLLHESTLPAVCQIAVVADQSSYPLHPALYEIDHIALKDDGAAKRCALSLVSTEWLDAHVRDWRDVAGGPRYAVQDDKSVRLVPRPLTDATLVLEGFRLPLAPMVLADKATAMPEINAAHHRQLVDWALFRAFSVPDADQFDPTRAANAEKAFTGYFGVRPDADLRRQTRHDVEHHNAAFWV